MKTSQIARQRWSREKRGKNGQRARTAVGRNPSIHVVWHGSCWVIAHAAHDAPAPAAGAGNAREGGRFQIDQVRAGAQRERATLIGRADDRWGADDRRTRCGAIVRGIGCHQLQRWSPRFIACAGTDAVDHAGLAGAEVCTEAARDAHEHDGAALGRRGGCGPAFDAARPRSAAGDAGDVGGCAADHAAMAKSALQRLGFESQWADNQHGVMQRTRSTRFTTMREDDEGDALVRRPS